MAEPEATARTPATGDGGREGRRGRGQPIRRRLVALALLAALTGGSGVVLDRVVGARAAPTGSFSGFSARTEGATSGAWFCPHGGGGGWRAWTVVANPGPSPVLVRLTTFGAGGVQANTEFELAPRTLSYRPVPASDPASATKVDYFGGWVGAAVVLQSTDPAGTAGERCQVAPSHSWALPDGSTATGDATHVVVMNPFAEDATFDITFFTDERDPVRPGSLTPLVLPAGTATSLDVRDFVLQSPTERLVSARVDVRIGRVVAGAVVTTPEGIRAESGIARPARRWTIPAGEGSTSVLDLMNRGTARADVSVIAQGDSGQRVIQGLSSVAVGPGQVREVDVPPGPRRGLSVWATNGTPVDVSLVTHTAGGDSAALSGVLRSAGRWLVLPTAPPSGGSAVIGLANPGSTPVTVTILLLGTDGVVSSGAPSSVIVPGGHAVSVALGGGVPPVAVVVQARGGTVVAGGASTGLGGTGYAATSGVPIPTR